MTRAKTMSPPVQFRLPIELYERLFAQAADEGMTVSQYVKARTITQGA